MHEGSGGNQYKEVTVKPQEPLSNYSLNNWGLAMPTLDKGGSPASDSDLHYGCKKILSGAHVTD